MYNNKNLQNSFERLPEKVQSVGELKLALYALNSISECITITDLNENLLYVNDAFLKTYGYTFPELEGKPITIIRSSKNSKEVTEQIHTATIKEGWRGNLWNKRKDGLEFLISLYTRIVRDENGNPVAHVGVARDLTEQLKNEALLRDTQDKFTTLFAELKDAVYETTPDGKFIDLNPAGLELLNVNSLEELNSINAKSFYLDEDEHEKVGKILEENGYLKDHEINIKKSTGEVATVLDTSTVVKDHTGKIIAYRGVLRDITKQKYNEGKLTQLVDRLEYLNKQLKESEEDLKISNGAKDKFFSIIAHDLRSPFSSLLNFSEFLIEDIEELSKEDIKSFAEKIHEAAKSVFDLLENLLQWSRVQSGKIPYQPTSFNISFKINQVISLLSNNAVNKKINIVNDVIPHAVVFADEDMIFSVIQNLLSNAIKFTNQGGTIIFRAMVRVSSIDVLISDNGVGIKEDDLKKLFSLDSHITTYGTNDEKGSGLGLILCKEMIERNRGTIQVESKLGEGTTFTFALPKA